MVLHQTSCVTPIFTKLHQHLIHNTIINPPLVNTCGRISICGVTVTALVLNSHLQCREGVSLEFEATLHLTKALKHTMTQHCVNICRAISQTSLLLFIHAHRSGYSTPSTPKPQILHSWKWTCMRGLSWAWGAAVDFSLLCCGVFRLTERSILCDGFTHAPSNTGKQENEKQPGNVLGNHPQSYISLSTSPAISIHPCFFYVQTVAEDASLPSSSFLGCCYLALLFFSLHLYSTKLHLATLWLASIAPLLGLRMVSLTLDTTNQLKWR